MKNYKTQASVIRDFQEGVLDREAAKDILRRIIQLQKIRKEAKVLTNKLNKAASRAGFRAPK